MRPPFFFKISGRRPASRSTGKTSAASSPARRLPPQRAETKPKRGPGGSAQITGQRQQGKERRAALRNGGAGQAEGSRPENAHAKAGGGAGEKRQRGERGEGGDQIGYKAEPAAGQHKALQRQRCAFFGKKQARKPHTARKEAGAEQIAQRFGNPQTALHKRACPLRHGKLRRAGGKHQQHKQPKKRFSEQRGDGMALFRGNRRADRHAEKQKSVYKREHCPENGHRRPAFYTEQGEKAG